MGAIANTSTTLATLVANGGTFTIAYPAGTSRATLQGTTGGQLVISQQTYTQDVASNVTFAFGATLITVTNNTGQSWAAGAEVRLSFGRTDINGGYNVTIGTGKQNAQAGDGSGAVLNTLTASGAVPAGTRILELNHISVVIAATIADLAAFPGLVVIRNTSASGTAAHTVTLTNGSWNGTNKVATLDAPGEALTVFVDAAGRGQIIENTGAVGLSG